MDPETLACLSSGLRAIALRRLRDTDAAHEAVQEILTRTLALASQGRTVNSDELVRIAHGIARHVFADVIRSRIRESRLSPLHENDQLSGPAFDALAPLIAAEEQERLRRALQQLGPADHQLLHLSYFEELTPAELSRRLGEPAERIRKRKSRALARLRQAFLGLTRSNAEQSEPSSLSHNTDALPISNADSCLPPLAPEKRQ